MIKNLVIVESPTKAKTIQNFLSKDFVIKSCNGHIRDLPKKELGVEVENNFKPIYEVLSEKKGIIAYLKKLTEDAENIWLATDEDREGEAISWHLVETLNIKEEKIKRIVFHEITKNAIADAIKTPRKIDKNLVNAQQTRRILDRLVGYELSPVLWEKIKKGLSAGRVQSVAVRLIVEREKEIEEFKSGLFYKVTGKFKLISTEAGTEKAVIEAELSEKLKTKEVALGFLKKCIGANFTVSNIEVYPTKKSPPPPFTTSTLQQEAGRKLGFSVAKTMQIAQQLYESGLITYMRTDSVNLSPLAIGSAKAEIIKLYGENYSRPRNYITKTKGAQEAHEAIRPTYMKYHTVVGGTEQRQLYELIWKRMIASQMSDAQIEKTNITINISTIPDNQFIAEGEVIKFDGFLKVYMESVDDEEKTPVEPEEGILPHLAIGQKLNYEKIIAKEHLTLPPYRYNEPALVRKLEELGIGRPSTYAPIISTIQKRGYVFKGNKEGTKRDCIVLTLTKDEIKEKIKSETYGRERGKLLPADIGIIVNNFLITNFDKIMDYNFTASVEEEFDKIASGDKVWNDMLQKFYQEFHSTIEKTVETSERISEERFLGLHPETNEKVYAKLGRYGPMIQVGEYNDKQKPRFASMRKDQSIQTITLEEALNLLKLPRELGKYENKEMIVDIGRFGPYIKHDSKFYSLSKSDDAYEITSERAIEIIQEKRKKEKILGEYKNKNVKVVEGRFSHYITIGKKKYKVPKEVNPKTLTLEKCLKIAEESEKAKK